MVVQLLRSLGATAEDGEVSGTAIEMGGRMTVSARVVEDPLDRGEVGFVNDFDFEGVKRFYTLKNHPAGYVRAWHAHRREAIQTVQKLHYSLDKDVFAEGLDKAGIDFDYWDRCRRECAVYFLSRVKERMVFEWVADQQRPKATVEIKQ